MKTTKTTTMMSCRCGVSFWLFFKYKSTMTKKAKATNKQQEKERKKEETPNPDESLLHGYMCEYNQVIIRKGVNLPYSFLFSS